MNWGSISAARQDALLQEMQRFIDEQSAAGSNIEPPLCIERMLWGMSWVICRAGIRHDDFLRYGRGLGGGWVGIRFGWFASGVVDGVGWGVWVRYMKVCKTSVAVISQFVTDIHEKENQIRVAVMAMI